MKVHKDNIKFIEEVGFQKGKLEVINKLKKKFKSNITVISKREFLNELEQLQKEIKVSGDSLTEFWDNPEDDRWDKEYNPDLLPETLKNKEEKQDED